MKCTNKLLACFLVICLSVSLTGCGSKEKEITNRYDIFQEDYLGQNPTQNKENYFATNLCVGGSQNIGTDKTDSQVAQGAGVFNTVTGTIPYAQNIYGKLYPASTTKILTAYVALKYGKLTDIVTVGPNALKIDPNSSTCGLAVGDKMTLQDMLYGMMMKSGNDAAIAIAEHISGSIDAFAEKMNEEAKNLGATTSHFVNPNGLPDDNHYTSVYDLYLIFQAAIQDETFHNIITTKDYTTNYTDASGAPKTQEWSSTNAYFSGEKKAPDGFTVIGGKTGTTGEAGYCLVLLSQNPAGQPIISIVLKADCKGNLYLLMNQMLAGYAK